MSCNVPCIVSKTGYFWDFWDKRIGCIIDYDSEIQHIEAVKCINKLKANPREVILEQGLDFETYKKRWRKLVNEVINTKS